MSEGKQTRSSTQLESFAAYCQSYPDQRFWQALRNWSGWNFVYVSQEPVRLEPGAPSDVLRDTFYFGGRDQ